MDSQFRRPIRGLLFAVVAFCLANTGLIAQDSSSIRKEPRRSTTSRPTPRVAPAARSTGSGLVSERYAEQPTSPPRRYSSTPPTATRSTATATAPQPTVRRASATANLQPAGELPADVFEDGGVVEEGYGGDDFGFGEFTGTNYFDNCCSIYGNAQALLWWTSGDRVPTLVTTAPVGTPAGVAGALGNPNTTTLFGNDELADTMRGGVRLTLGACITPYLQVEGSYFGLGELDDSFARTSNETPILARPFLNIANAANDHQRIAFQGAEGVVTGSINVDHHSRFQGVDALARRLLVQMGNGCASGRLQLTGGYRYLSLNESLDFRSSSTIVRDPNLVLAAGTVLNVSESFSVKNTFNGGDIGLTAVFQGPMVGLDLYGRMGIGSTRQVVTINGSTTSTVPQGGSTTRAGGLFAQPSNIGVYTRDEMTFVPQFGADLHYRINPCWQFNIGYSFMFWSDVVRPGEQIDTAINPSQFNGGVLVGAARPQFQFNDGYFWAHGLSLGLDCRF